MEPTKAFGVDVQGGDLFLESGRLLSPPPAATPPPLSRGSACTTSAGQRQVGQGGREHMHSGFGAQGLSAEKAPFRACPHLHHFWGQAGRGQGSKVGEPKRHQQTLPRAPHAHTRMHPQVAQVNGPTRAHLPAQGHRHTGTHAGATESQTDTRSRCAEGKVTKAKPLTGDTQTPPTAHGAQFWRQTIMNKAWPAAPCRGATAGRCQGSFPSWGLPPGRLPQRSQGMAGSQGLPGGGDSLTQGPPCHTLTCLHAGSCGGQHARSLLETARPLAPMKDTPLWTLPRAIPGWAVLEGAVCIPEATLTQRKGLQPWPYIGGAWAV